MNQTVSPKVTGVNDLVLLRKYGAVFTGVRPGCKFREKTPVRILAIGPTWRPDLGCFNGKKSEAGGSRPVSVPASRFSFSVTDAHKKILHTRAPQISLGEIGYETTRDK